MQCGVIIVSILAKTANQNCNALATLSAPSSAVQHIQACHRALVSCRPECCSHIHRPNLEHATSICSGVNEGCGRHRDKGNSIRQLRRCFEHHNTNGTQRRVQQGISRRKTRRTFAFVRLERNRNCLIYLKSRGRVLTTELLI